MNEEDKNFIPSRTSPRGGRRACYCKHRNTYSRECCDGSIWAQGLGTIYLTPEE